METTKKTKKKIPLWGKIVRAVLCTLLILLLVGVTYVIVIFASYYRLDDNLALEVKGSNTAVMQVGK